MTTMKNHVAPCTQRVDTVSPECGHTKTKTKTRDKDPALERQEKSPIWFRDGECVIDPDLMKTAFGSDNPDFVTGLANQLGNAAIKGREVDEAAVCFFASMVAGIKPEDQLEAMLAAQMAAIHNATMVFARRLAHVDNIAQQDSAERAFNKLARTFTMQLEALKRYRSSGQQVVVKHVTVNDGGQAVVGNITAGGGVKE